jgi:serine protease Do
MYRERENRGFLRTFLISLTTSLAVGAFLLFYSGIKNQAKPEQMLPDAANPNMPVPQQIEYAKEDERHVAEVVAASASPGVVGISVQRADNGSLFDGNAAEKWGLGSGVIVSKDGYIVTNHHVAGGRNKRIIVSLADGRNVDGTTLWSDPVLDLAIVKINADNLTPVPLGDATKLKVGEPAIAIGNPFGLQFQRSVTSGVISGLNRTIQVEVNGAPNYMEDLIQTDAGINPGNSGGPLLNSRGEVVGINTIKVSTAEAIGFAIPINVAVPIISHYVDDGEFVEPYMGLFAYDKEVIPFVEQSFNLDKGIYVADVDKKGPAHKAGIKEGCIITQVDGIEINTMMQLRCYIYSKKPGDVINVTHLSRESGDFMTIQIKLAARENEYSPTR